MLPQRLQNNLLQVLQLVGHAARFLGLSGWHIDGQKEAVCILEGTVSTRQAIVSIGTLV